MLKYVRIYVIMHYTLWNQRQKSCIYRLWNDSLYYIKKSEQEMLPNGR